MRRLLAAFLAAPLLAIAAPGNQINVQLEKVPLVELVRIVYGDMLHKPYILDPDAVALQDVVTVDLRNVKPDQIAATLADLLADRGLSITHTSTASIIGKKPDDPGKELLIYRPKHRPVAYLTDLLRPIFPQGFTAAQQQTAQAFPQTFVQLPQSGQQSAAQQQATPAQQVFSQSQASPARDVLLFNGTPSQVAKLEKALAQLDQAAGEVLVKAVVYEVTRQQRDQSAVDLVMNVLKGRLSAAFQPSGPATGTVKLSAGGITAAFSALSTDSRFKVVSAPSVRIVDGAEGRFSVGADVPVLGQVTYQNNGQPVQSVEYKPSGVLFRVRPSIREQGIALNVFQQLSDFIPTTTGVNNSPTLTKRELQTDVQVQPDELLVIGGLEQNKTTDDETGIPFLPFLTSTSKASNGTEIVLLLQATRI